ncbi:hypothetical protein RF55_5530 [Lasius niger]|uniref:Uncharacterized protein n=1 Tax=Lasius niger TaxID=67767 RepID=A0A0J7NP97_LASNI|nr:hypothetical protein RF55_5530 [Lasius niger]
MDWKLFTSYLLRSYPHLSLIDNPNLDSLQKYDTLISFIKESINLFPLKIRTLLRSHHRHPFSGGMKNAHRP